MLKYVLTVGAAESTGNPVLGFLMLVGIIWFVAWICTPEKPKYRVERTTSVRRVK